MPHSDVRTERTSKALKLQLVISALLFWAGLGASLWLVYQVAEGAEQSAPALLYVTIVVGVGGAAWWLLTRMRVWWHHG